ncbi:hypothetical protein TNCV_2472581 [Trichonephila clavipes]|nr:hypothetical protein TNCV_2472581 [Trichonephila clavipes]
MEQSTVPESPLKEPMEPSRFPKSPLKNSVDSKPPIVSKSPDLPVKKAHVKKVDSVIHCSPRSRERRNEERRKEERRNEERRPRDPGCIEDPISDPRIEGMISNLECFGDPSAITAHFPGKCPSLFPQPRIGRAVY